ncbi:TPA: ComEC/Rec2 family competence protein [Clostridium perfringens]|uniref:ComEC/Rec2 family competence protein n=1 Tax=Clostridium perfringens TaxID=1502 RepID=UPI001A2F1260|nr:ComEC/Rec2 family competence protein [Clostridium perfringens]MDM0956958.1 ComEC/Rec2 family competence protein [Clostridium perfringens]HAT4209162.1 ComEC/Rec2 family competence protein [Clostridium perfringens]
MKKFEKVIVNRPLGLICIFTILGIITYYFGSFNLIGTAFLVVPLILFSYLLLDIENFNIGIIFFLIAILSCTIYYEPKFQQEGVQEIRIIEVTDKVILGKIDGRIVEVRNQSGSELEYGEKIYGACKFKRNINLDRGYVGQVFLKKVLKREKDLIYKIKNIPKKYYENLSKNFSTSESALLNAVLWGDKENLTYNQKDFLSDLGVIHLICISGFHIALLFSIIYKKFSFKIALSICTIYVILVGASSSALRALIMITLLKSSKRLFKTYDHLSSISLGAVILLIYKPYNLFSMGFLLSFGGTLGIVLFYKKLLEGFYMLPPKLNEYLSLGLSAQAFIYPILVIAFGKFSINFLISTFLVTPIIVILLQILLISILIGGNLIGVIVFLINIIFMVFRGILVFLDKVVWVTPYLSPVFAIAYMTMFLWVYMSLKGFKKFKIGVYLVIPVLLLNLYVFGAKIRVVEDKWNKAIVIESGFKKVALVNNNSDYFKKSIMKKEYVNEVIHLKKESQFELTKRYSISIEDNFNTITLMPEDSDYDIIDLIQKKSAYIL